MSKKIKIVAPQKAVKCVWPQAPFTPAKKRGVGVTVTFKNSRGQIHKNSRHFFGKSGGSSNEY